MNSSLQERQSLPPLLIDQAASRFQEFEASIGWAALAAQSAKETASRVYAMRPPPQPRLVGEEAADYLQSIIPVTESDILDCHAAYGSVRWLWYLRRAPDRLFEGEYTTTLGYDRMLAELVASKFTAIDVSENPDRVSFPADVYAFRHLARYVGRLKLLSNLHSLYRRLGKGGVLDASTPTLIVETSETIERAIQIYDSRHDTATEFIGAGLGMAAIDPDIDLIARKSAGAEPEAFLTSRSSSGFTCPITYPNESGGRSTGTASIRHAPMMLNLSKILSPLGKEGGVPDYLPKIASLCQLLLLVPSICAQVPWALSSIVQQGYVFIGKQRLRNIVDHYLHEVVDQLAPRTLGFAWPKNFDDWHEAISGVVASTWPIASGNILRPFHDNLLIDVTCASQALLHRLELTRSPLIGNIRAQAFELDCQQMINGTPWKPSQGIQDLRGRQLRRNGKIITDIDSIAEKNGALLVVSCKSIIYDRDYDQGVFKSVNNTQHTIDAAVAHWLGIVDDLKLNPIGDNFDFSQFDEVIGVVCTPFVGYSSDERTLAFARPNLRICASILELRDWLAVN
ncbi:MAG: hypothetical protein ING69_03080 [Rhodocyclaceae bacterium]|nr:hypothetical protein [Rhodocyclaceae bacterium]